MMPMVCINCASISSAIVITSGNSKLKSRAFILSFNVPDSVT